MIVCDSKAEICPVCKLELLESVVSPTGHYCSEFCYNATEKEKCDLSVAEEGNWLAHMPCSCCGIGMEGGYSKGVICSDCSNKEKLIRIGRELTVAAINKYLVDLAVNVSALQPNNSQSLSDILGKTKLLVEVIDSLEAVSGQATTHDTLMGIIQKRR